MLIIGHVMLTRGSLLAMSNVFTAAFMFVFPYLVTVLPASGGIVRVSQQDATSPTVVRTAKPSWCFASAADQTQAAFAFLGPIDNAWANPGVLRQSIPSNSDQVFEAIRSGDTLQIRAYNPNTFGVDHDACWVSLNDAERTAVRNALLYGP